LKPFKSKIVHENHLEKNLVDFFLQIPSKMWPGCTKEIFLQSSAPGPSLHIIYLKVKTIQNTVLHLKYWCVAYSRMII